MQAVQRCSEYGLVTNAATPGGHRKRLNLGLVCFGCVYFVLPVFLS